MTHKPQDEVAIALHDCDNNVDAAVLNLLEGKYNQVIESSSYICGIRNNRGPGGSAKIHFFMSL